MLFRSPATSDSLTLSFTSFSASDTNGVTGYLVNESATTPDVSDTGWSGTAQTQYVFTTEGAKTLYAWAKDGVGNISTSGSGSVTVTLPVTPTPTPSSGGGNGAPVGSLGQHRQDVSNLLAPTISIPTSTNLTSLQDQIASLTLQLNSLLAQTHTTTTSYTPYNFTRNLYYRMVGTDVLHLQQFLNTHGFVLTTTELGSSGSETTKFGLLTYKALKLFQTSVNLPSTGYFGPMTREVVNKK